MHIEVELIKWLNTQPGLPEAYLETPNPRPASFITIERTGGQTSRFISSPAVAVQVWGRTRLHASESAHVVSDALLAFTRQHPLVGRVEITGPYNWPDPDSRQARYQLSANFTTV